MNIRDMLMIVDVGGDTYNKYRIRKGSVREGVVGPTELTVEVWATPYQDKSMGHWEVVKDEDTVREVRELIAVLRAADR